MIHASVSSLLTQLSGFVKTVVTDLLQQPRAILVLRLTVLLLLLYGSSRIILDVPLRVLCGLLLVSPPLLTSQAMWVVICGLIWWVNATDWLWIDNHKFLISYWSLVCALAVAAEDTDGVLSWNARWLIGLTFLFATVWKIMAGEYWDGSFLHYTFLTDGRVEAIATLIGGLDPHVLSQNRLLEFTLQRLPDASASVTLGSSSRLQGFTLAASYWTLVIEGAVALSFLAPARWFGRWRDGLLLTFIVTTYFLLPVLGFAYILAILGYAQCSSRQVKTRILYLCVFVVLQFARLPWESWIG